MLTKSKINLFLLLKLPSAFLCGVRVKFINHEKCQVAVKHRWINKNPFNSMYFAVQAMAAELSTGALVLSYIKASHKKISMLVANNKSNFSKKATGRIEFTCVDGLKVRDALNETIKTGFGQTIWLKSIGIDEKRDQVSVFEFEWTVKIK